MLRIRNGRAVGWATLALGLIAAVTPAWADTDPVGAGATLGLGALTAMYAMWSLIARDPTKDHWALSVVGLVLFLAPWVGGFAGDAAAWVAWTVGLLVIALAGTAYVRDEDANLAEAVRVNQLATYRLQHKRQLHGSAETGQSTPNTHIHLTPAR